MDLMELGAVMRGLPEQVVKALMALLERVEAIILMTVIIRHGILSPMADKEGLVGLVALPGMEPKVERAARAATAQIVLVHRVEQEMEGRGVKVARVGTQDMEAGEEREAMARMVAIFR